MRYAISIVLVLIGISAEAEEIDGPANVREEPNGRLVFSLDDKVYVETGNEKNGWLDINLPVYVDIKGGFADPSRLLLNKGATLYDKRGKRIGAAIERVEAEPFYDEDVHNGRRIVILKGFTHRQNIRADSILELQLGAVLNASKTLSLADFRRHLKSFHYQDWMTREQFISYLQTGKPTTVVNPWPRAILFFYQKKLIAVYHGRSIPSSRITPSTTIRDGTMSYVVGVAPELRRRFAAIYYPIIEGAD